MYSNKRQKNSSQPASDSSTANQFAPRSFKEESLPNAVQVKIMKALQKRDVVIVGEKHNDINREQEQKHWAEYNIQVKYESDSIFDTNSKSDITPDPVAWRLMYFLEDFYENLLKYKSTNDAAEENLYKGLCDDTYNRYIKEMNELPMLPAEEFQIINDKINYKWFESYKTHMYNTLDLLDTTEGKKKLNSKNSEISNAARVVLEIIDSIPGKQGLANSELITRRVRSQKMLENILKIQTSNKTIYKVGNNHIIDMRKEPEGASADWIFSKVDYETIFS